MKKIEILKKNENDLGNFEIHKRIDTPYFASLKTTQLLYQTIFYQTHNLKVKDNLKF